MANRYTCVNPGSCDCGRDEGEFCRHWAAPVSPSPADPGQVDPASQALDRLDQCLQNPTLIYSYRARDLLATVRGEIERLRTYINTDGLVVSTEQAKAAVDKIDAFLAGVGGRGAADLALATVRERLDTLTAQVEQLTQERDEYKEAWEGRIRSGQDMVAENARLTALLETTREGLREMEAAALKAAQLLPMTLSTSVESDHRGDHASWAGWLLRHKALPKARALLAASSPPPGDTDCEHEWVSARNKAVLSGLICRKCHVLAPESGVREDGQLGKEPA